MICIFFLTHYFHFIFNDEIDILSQIYNPSHWALKCFGFHSHKIHFMGEPSLAIQFLFYNNFNFLDFFTDHTFKVLLHQYCFYSANTNESRSSFNSTGCDCENEYCHIVETTQLLRDYIVYCNYYWCGGTASSTLSTSVSVNTRSV